MPVIRCECCGGIIEFKAGNRLGICSSCGAIRPIDVDESLWRQAKLCRVCGVTNFVRPGSKTEVCRYCGEPLGLDEKKRVTLDKVQDSASLDYRNLSEETIAIIGKSGKRPKKLM